MSERCGFVYSIDGARCGIARSEHYAASHDWVPAAARRWRVPAGRVLPCTVCGGGPEDHGPAGYVRHDYAPNEDD